MSSGILAQLGIADETTYGTFVAPTRFIEFTEEDLALELERIESEGLRSGQRVQRQDHWAAGRRAGAGSISFEVANKHFGLFFELMFGTLATTSSGTGKKHACSEGSLTGDMLSFQLGRPSTAAGVVQPFSYSGGKITDWTLTQELDSLLMLELGMDFQNEVTSTGLTAASAPTLTEIFHYGELAITVAASAFDAKSFELKCDLGLDVERYFLRGNTLKKEPLEAKRRVYEGKLVGEFEDLTAYNRFVNGTAAAIVATWTSPNNYDVALPFKLVVTINSARFDGATPNVKDEGIIEVELPFVALDGGSGAVTLDYYTSDATP